MSSKLSSYSTLEEFMTDFNLIITNAKTYNPPYSIYYKAAEKLASAAKSYNEKNMYNLENPTATTTKEIHSSSIESSSVNNSTIRTIAPSASPSTQPLMYEREMLPRAAKKKYDYPKMKKAYYLDDGSSDILPEEINQQSYSGFDYLSCGPYSCHSLYNCQPNHQQQLSGQTLSQIALIYGDPRGEAYIKSILDFGGFSSDIFQKNVQEHDELTSYIYSKCMYITQNSAAIPAVVKHITRSLVFPPGDDNSNSVDEKMKQSNIYHFLHKLIAFHWRESVSRRPIDVSKLAQFYHTESNSGIDGMGIDEILEKNMSVFEGGDINAFVSRCMELIQTLPSNQVYKKE